MTKMFRLAAAFVAILALGGCAAQMQKLETAWEVVTSASISPTQIIVAGNAFDAAEASATQYLVYCKAHKEQAGCALPIRKQVVTAVRAGRAARNELEPYAAQGKAGPAAIYNTLMATIASLQASAAKAGVLK